MRRCSGFAWRLEALFHAQQESRVDAGTRPRGGAPRLMRVLRRAGELGVGDVRRLEGGVHGGVTLLARGAAMRREPQIGETDRPRVTLVAYGCGPGHLIRGRRLAAHLSFTLR